MAKPGAADSASCRGVSFSIGRFEIARLWRDEGLNTSSNLSRFLCAKCSLRAANPNHGTHRGFAANGRRLATREIRRD